MEKIDNKWVASEGTLFVRISDSKIMGAVLFLGGEDSIENYMERAFTEEEQAEFEKQYAYGDFEGAEEATSGGSGDDD